MAQQSGIASEKVKPYAQQAGGKKEQVATMFDNIATRYDFLNRFFTVGIDRSWRRKAIKLLAPLQPQAILDVATGTGDFALEAAQRLKPRRVVGVDISPGMLAVGRTKIQKAGKQGIIEMLDGDSENLPFENNTFDAATVGFGARNFENLRAGLSEIHRVLKPGGEVMILEPGFPQRFPMKQLFGFYFTVLLPALGRLISRDSSAYAYLPASVQAFPYGEDFLAICRQAGFQEARFQTLTFGTCVLYRLRK